MRQQHETAHAASIARVRGQLALEDQPEKSQRMEIIKGFHEILRQQQARGVGTGKERSQRWSSSQSSQVMQSEDLTGNAANAAEAASKTAAKVCSFFFQQGIEQIIL